MKITINLKETEVKRIRIAVNEGLRVVNLPTKRTLSYKLLGVTFKFQTLHKENAKLVAESELTYYYDSVFFGHTFSLSGTYHILRQLALMYLVSSTIELDEHEFNIIKPYLDIRR